MLCFVFVEAAGFLRVRAFGSALWGWARQDLRGVNSTARRRSGTTDFVVVGHCGLNSGRRAAFVTRGRVRDERWRYIYSRMNGQGQAKASNII